MEDCRGSPGKMIGAEMDGFSADTGFLFAAGRSDFQIRNANAAIPTAAEPIFRSRFKENEEAGTNWCRLQLVSDFR